tara:strand:+ start:1156 stop:1317 length:162 start_codon:yes stop_codon:yes gene_type:complete
VAEQEEVSVGGIQSSYAVTPATGRALALVEPTRDVGGRPFVLARYAPAFEATE